MPQRFGLYGGSFDPVHVGHLIAARSAAESLGWERVIFLPSAHPPNKSGQPLLDVDHRVAMVKLAIDGERRFAIDDFDLRSEGPTFTIDTLEHFALKGGDGVEWQWLIGADTLLDLSNWHRISDLLDRFRIVTAARPGCDAPDIESLRPALSDGQIRSLRDGILVTPRIDIAASDIRDRLRKGLSVRYLVPDRVLEYLQRHDLYRASESEAR